MSYRSKKFSTAKLLKNSKTILKQLIKALSEEYKYVSILGTDTKGKDYYVKKQGISLNDSIWNERGFVLRVFNGINYSEFSFNELDNTNIEEFINFVKQKIESDLKYIQKSNLSQIHYPVVKEAPIKKQFLGEYKIDRNNISDKDVIDKMCNIRDKGLSYSNLLIDYRVNIQTVQVSKIFLSLDKELEQSYVWSEGILVSVARKNTNTKFYFKTFSGLKGIELLDEMDEYINEVAKTTIKLLDASKIKPGEYEVICSPDVSGIMAHEAFGHGVEADMFVKNRAKAKEYINKPVASKLVTMHDGASAATEVSSYLFDDEGTLGNDTIVIDKGILKRGLSDMLSALKLKTSPTGNGKRESFERKAYARMTNTFFESGKDKLEDMISSIKNGYLLENCTSGMEDPKNWGIQCMVNIGREIRDGKLTDNIVSPVILTGYVPDVLKSISMVSDNLELEGVGACGKGHKEFCKVSSGGPYIKAKVRLG